MKEEEEDVHCVIICIYCLFLALLSVQCLSKGERAGQYSQYNAFVIGAAAAAADQ